MISAREEPATFRCSFRTMLRRGSKIHSVYAIFLVALFAVEKSTPHRVPLQVLNLSEGSVCRESEGLTAHHVCKRADDCEFLPRSIRNNSYFNVCSFDRKVPIVCCPPALDQTTAKVPTDKNSTVGNIRKSQNIAVEKCRQYSALQFPESSDVFISVVGGLEAKPHEFPHMAILGYGNTTENRQDWKCGGTLISERWILSAAHCHRMNTRVQWARLGDLDVGSTEDDARPKDYRIARHVIHPNYKESERYNDIALFQLETDAEFSLYVRPICLNADPSLDPVKMTATGWGRTASGESTSDVLLKITLDVFSTSDCNETYFSNDNKKLQLGILHESMICAGSSEDNEDTCTGDSGGPLQTLHYEEYVKIYTQFGITSFGAGFCGIKDTPAVYTKVSNYIPWIEGIVWSDSSEND